MSDTKTSLVNGNVTDLTPICRALDGLKQGPQPADWDPDTTLYGADEWAEYGVIDGWMWATDNSTALVQRSELYEDLDDERRAAKGRAVIKLVTADQPAPLYVVNVYEIARVGGVLGEIPRLGIFDLDRLVDAALWVAGDPDEDTAPDTKIVVSHDEMSGGDLVRITGSAGRVAAVIGCKPDQPIWLPRVQLPLYDADGNQYPEVLA